MPYYNIPIIFFDSIGKNLERVNFLRATSTGVAWIRTSWTYQFIFSAFSLTCLAAFFILIQESSLTHHLLVKDILAITHFSIVLLWNHKEAVTVLPHVITWVYPVRQSSMNVSHLLFYLALRNCKISWIRC